MNSRNDNSGFFLSCVALGAVALGVYFFLKTVGEIIRLPVRETGWLVLGLIGFFSGLLYSWVTARRVALCAWWLTAVTFPFLTPALDYWSLDAVSKMIIDSTWHTGELKRDWYGENWAQVLMLIALCGIAAFVHRRDRF